MTTYKYHSMTRKIIPEGLTVVSTIVCIIQYNELEESELFFYTENFLIRSPKSLGDINKETFIFLLIK